MSKVPDAKVIAMINDLSVGSLMTLVCFHPNLQAAIRAWLANEYRARRLDSATIIEEWENEK